VPDSRAGPSPLRQPGLGVGVCAALEVIGAYTSPALEKVRLWAALSAVVCAVAMLARALVLTIKLRQQS
jgi:hypothetical protein